MTDQTATDPSPTASPGEAPPERPGLSVRAYLAFFTLALVVPIVAFVGFLLYRIAATEQGRLEREAHETAEAIAVAVDRDTTGLLASLDVLSLSVYLRNGDLPAFQQQARELASRQGIIPVLTDIATRRQLVNARVAPGAELPTSNVPFGPAEIAAGRPFVTDLFRGQVSGEFVYAVAVPVERDGVPTYILSFSLSPDRLRRIVSEVDVPSRYTASIVDRAGIVMSRTVRAQEFVGRAAPPDMQAAATGLSGTWEGRALDGRQILGAYARSRLTGFRAAVGIERGDLMAPLWASLSLFAAIGTVIAGLSTLLGFYFGKRITAPIGALARQAVRLGQGEAVPPLRTGLREADAVGRELSAASEMRLRREAELQNANEEVQRFAYIVSHDLRSPLVNIMGFTTELEALRTDTFARLDQLRGETAPAADKRQDKQLAEDIDEAIAFIKASIGKMDRLIAAILKLSREGRRDFRPERIDMDALVGTIRASVAHQAEAAGATVAAGPLKPITSDRLAIEQIFSNLVDNAVKYLRPGVPGRIEVACREEGADLVYEVRDNGRGIDGKDWERVFELFRRSGTQDKPGEGIGLAHVRALVRRLGGTIALTSKPGEGSVFSVTLPRRWSAEARREAE